MKAKGQQVFLLGESPLVEEYSELCLVKGYSVSVRFNPGVNAQLPKKVKKATAPAKSTILALELTNTSAEAKKKNLVLLDGTLDRNVPIISSSITATVAEQSSWIKSSQRLVGIGALPSLLDGALIELAASNDTSEQTVATAKEFVATLGKEASIVRDSIGMVMPRILCMLVNESYFAMMEGVATGNDIDTAMKLGTNYPSGPVEWGEQIGIRHVHAVLSSLYKHFGEDRYRAAPLLQQAAFTAR
jgi:3-hydroxybutyryl-CoA dehydrogenase